jgi:hypothetical protein
MIFSTFFHSLIITVIIGYSYLFKIFFKIKDDDIYNLDLLYGIFFLFFLSLVLNFLFPLKFFSLIIIFIGFIFFIYCFYKKKIKVNLLFYALIIFVYIFIIFTHGDNIDSPMYHHQIIKWLYNYKISLGLTNLEIRFGDNSLWFSFLSLLQFKLKNFNSIFTLNIIPFVLLSYEILKPKKSISYLFLNLSLSFIFFFSYLHPYKNGIILNHLHNPEVDTVAMIFFIMSCYLFLIFLDKKNKDIFYLMTISSLLCILIKISYLGVILFPLSALILFYRKNISEILKTKLNIIILLVFLLWLCKNFLISGCLIFPLSVTCFNVNWSPGIEEIDTYSKVVKGFARDTRERLRYLDFEHTIYSYNWILPWLKDYALNTALLKISLTIVFLSTSLFFLKKKFSNLINIDSEKKNDHLIVIFVLLINLLFWFQAPEIRFGWGTIISLNCYLISILFFYNVFFKKINLKLIKYSTLFVLSLLIFDNINNLNFKNLMSPYTRNFNYSKIVKIYDLNKVIIYQSKDRQCYDFPGICVNSPKDKYFLDEKLGYLIFKNK